MTNQLTIKERIQLLQQKMDSEKDFEKRLEIGDELIDLKRKAGYLIPPKQGEDCISCSG